MSGSIENEPVAEATAIDIEIAYAQDALYEAEQDASEAREAYRDAESNSKQLQGKRNLAQESLKSLIEKANQLARQEYKSRVLELFGVDPSTLSKDEPLTIELDDEIIETFLSMEEVEYDRATKASAEIERLRFGRVVNDHESHRNWQRSFVGSMVKAAKKMKPGAHFVRERNDSDKSIATVAGDPSEHSAAKVVARFYAAQERQDADVRIGIIVPLVGEDEPAEFFSQAPSFNIDYHIKDLIDKHRELMDQPLHEVYPLVALQLAGKLDQFDKKKLVKDLRKRAEEALVSVIAGKSYHIYPNQTTEKPQFSVGRYVEMLAELQKLGEDKLESAIDERAKSAVENLRWRNEDINRRHSANFLNIPVDTFTFVKAELLFRRRFEAADAEVEPLDVYAIIDAHAEFFKRGYHVLDAKKVSEETAADLTYAN